MGALPTVRLLSEMSMKQTELITGAGGERGICREPGVGTVPGPESEGAARPHWSMDAGAGEAAGDADRPRRAPAHPGAAAAPRRSRTRCRNTSRWNRPEHRRFTVVGHDCGVLVGFRLALAHPEAVGHLVNTGGRVACSCAEVPCRASRRTRSRPRASIRDGGLGGVERGGPGGAVRSAGVARPSGATRAAPVSSGDGRRDGRQRYGRRAEAGRQRDDLGGPGRPRGPAGPVPPSRTAPPDRGGRRPPAR